MDNSGIEIREQM